MVLDKVGLEYIHNSAIVGSLKGIKGEMVDVRDVREALSKVDRVKIPKGWHDGGSISLTSCALEVYDQMKKLHEGVRLNEFIKSFDEALKTYQLETLQTIP
jgi:hypothetical protein